MLEKLKTLACKGLRKYGFPVISSEERSEAQRIGANYASKIYEPIFSELELRIKSLKEEISRDNSICLEKLDIPNTDFDNSYKKDKYRLINIDWDFFSSRILNLYFPLRINKTDVGEYKETIKYGFERLEEVYKEKIKKLMDEYTELLIEKTKTEVESDEMIKIAKEVILKKVGDLEASVVYDVLKRMEEI